MYAKQRAFVLATAVLLVLSAPSLARGDDDKKKGDGLLQAQLTQFNGGCPPNPVEEEGGCIDVQFTVHRAPGCTTGPNAELDGFSLGMVRKIAGPPEPLAGGSSILVRADDGVSTTLNTTDLAPKAPYTMWWVGFNPDNPCVATCNCDGDHLRPGLDAVFFATGAESDRLGTATFAANVDYGELPGGVDQIPVFETPGGPITFDAPIEEGAELHNVVRAHGPRLAGKGNKGDDDHDDEDDD